MKKRAIASCLTILLLSGCGGGAYKKSPVVTPQPMSCTGEIPAQITLYSPDEAKLVFEQKAYNLKRIQTASGVKYGNSDISYWNKGINAMITKDNGVVTTCTYIPRSGL